MLDIQGTVANIRYRNEDNLYTIFDLNTEDGMITAVGNIFEINLGDKLAVSGELIFHNVYGEQIKIKECRILPPSSIEEIKKYLSSGIIHNIGEKRAKLIVKEFGEDTLDIMTNYPEKLLKISGIGKKTLEKIHKSVVESNKSREAIMFLQRFNFGNKLSYEIYAIYKEDTISLIKENPYRLVSDVRGIGFHTADNIAFNLGISKDSKFRIFSGIIHILNKSAQNNGNCFMYLEEFLEEVSLLLDIDKEIIESEAKSMAYNLQLKILDIDNRRCIYLRNIYEMELYITKKLISIIKEDNSIDGIDILEEINYIEKLDNIIYSSMQKKAIESALKENILIITGGPGTGKTTIIKAIISIAENLKTKFVLCAPTGRAAKRMEESTGKEASTLHRLLGYKSIDRDILLDFNENNPLDVDLIIVDEMSMVDIFLMNNLLKAVKKTTKLIFVGDKDQLPSVGAGNILNDMIKSDVIPTIVLDTIFRQGELSNIVKNAHLINNGNRPILNEENKDFFFINTKNDVETLDIIVDLVVNRLPKYYKVNPLEDIQVLTPTKRGVCGVDSINAKLQEKLNPPEFNKVDYTISQNIYRENDKIMQVKNNYDIELKDDFSITKGLYNGDIGRIRNIILEEKSMELVFDDKIAKIKLSDLSEIKLAYCTTIHKSQGSEFPIVIIPMANAPDMLLTRNILYTGITRAKSIVILVGNKNILYKMIDKNIINKRNSTLSYNLKQLAKVWEINE